MTVTVETSRDETYVRGQMFEQNPDKTQGRWLSDWVQLADQAYDEAFWFVGRPEIIAQRLGVDTTSQRAKEFDDFLDGNLGGWYYVYHASRATAPSEDILKWILSNSAAEMNSRDWSLDKMMFVFPYYYLNELLGLVKDGILSKSHAKDVFVRVLDGEFYEKVVRDLKYYQAEGGEAFVDAVFARYVDQVEKAKADPKLVNWLVGQVMKEAKGKVGAAEVQEIVKQRLG